VRWWFELDLDCLLVGFDVVPLSKRMPALGYDLDQNFPLRNLGNLRGAVLIRLEIQFSQFVFMEEAARFVESDIDASVSNRFSIGCAGYFDSQLYRGRFGRLFILFVGMVGRSLLALRGGLILGGRLVLNSRLSGRQAGNTQECCEEGQREAARGRLPAARGRIQGIFLLQE
jgi:hypothetical protein